MFSPNWHQKLTMDQRVTVHPLIKARDAEKPKQPTEIPGGIAICNSEMAKNPPREEGREDPKAAGFILEVSEIQL